MKKTALTLFLIFTILFLNAENTKPRGTVSGRVTDAKTGSAVENASVTIWDADGGRILRGTVTDRDGYYIFDYLEPGQYMVQASHLGYHTSIKQPAAPSGKPEAGIRLTPEYHELSPVVITPDVTSIQTLLGEKIINVGRDLQTTGNASKDLMNNLPSVMVDMKGTMMLRGSANVRYFIDGRPTNVTSMELLNIMPTIAIEKVELITNPSSKEYPDGPSGIVNLVTSKSRKKGFGAGADLGFGTGDKYNAGVNLNYRNDKLNVWGSYLFFQNRNDLNGQVEKTDIPSVSGQASAGVSRQDVDGYYLGNTHEIKAGIEYDISPRTQVSYSGAVRSVWRESVMNISSNSFVPPSAESPSSAYASNAKSRSNMSVITNGVHFRHNFDSKNRIDADVNYEVDNTSSHSEFAQDFTTKVSPYMPDRVIDTSGYNNDYTYLSARLDYTNQGTNYKFEVGASANLRTMDNPYHDKSITVMPSPRPGITSLYDTHFKFNEDVYAVYATYSRTFGRFTAALGIRMDASKTTVKSIGNEDPEDDAVYTRDTVNFYPSAHFTYRLDGSNSFMLAYSRRVARPDTRQLNPNAVSTNPARPNIGNPFLTPEYSNSIDLTYHGKWHSANVIASVFYNYNKDVIQQYLTPVNPVNGQQSPGIVYNTYKNYGTSYFIGFEAIASGDPLRFLNISGSFNAYYVDYSIGENTFWNKCGVNWNAKLSANIKITDGISAMLLGRYKGRQTYIQGVEDANGTMDAGLRWDFLKKKLSLSARLTDVFDTFSSKTHATIDAGNGALQRELNYENYETRVFYMSISYRF